MFKILRLDSSSTWTENFQMYKLDLEKAEEADIKLPISIGPREVCGVGETTRECQRNIYFWFIDCAKAFHYMDYNKLENS